MHVVMSTAICEEMEDQRRRRMTSIHLQWAYCMSEIGRGWQPAAEPTLQPCCDLRLQARSIAAGAHQSIGEAAFTSAWAP